MPRPPRHRVGSTTKHEWRRFASGSLLGPAATVDGAARTRTETPVARQQLLRLPRLPASPRPRAAQRARRAATNGRTGYGGAARTDRTIAGSKGCGSTFAGRPLEA